MKKWNEISGFFFEEECAEIQRLCAGLDVLEIGAMYGRSTVCLAQTAKSVLSVDTWCCDAAFGNPPSDVFSDQIFKGYLLDTQDLPNVSYIIGRSDEVIPELDLEFDAVFVDGDHNFESVVTDVRVSYPKLKDDGIFIFHDWGWLSVRDAILSMFDMEHIVGPVVSLTHVQKRYLKEGAFDVSE